MPGRDGSAAAGGQLPGCRLRLGHPGPGRRPGRLPPGAGPGHRRGRLPRDPQERPPQRPRPAPRRRLRRPGCRPGRVRAGGGQHSLRRAHRCRGAAGEPPAAGSPAAAVGHPGRGGRRRRRRLPAAGVAPARAAPAGRMGAAVAAASGRKDGMSRPRLFLPAAEWAGRVPLRGQARHKLVQVLRLEAGGEVEVFDGEGRACRAELERDGQGWFLRLGPARQQGERRRRVRLGLALSKGRKPELVVRMATEVGVSM